jgi:hypothetical protein
VPCTLIVRLMWCCRSRLTGWFPSSCCCLQTHIHQRSPIFLGCKRDVERVIELYKEYGQN